MDVRETWEYRHAVRAIKTAVHWRSTWQLRAGPHMNVVLAQAVTDGCITDREGDPYLLALEDKGLCVVTSQPAGMLWAHEVEITERGRDFIKRGAAALEEG